MTSQPPRVLSLSPDPSLYDDNLEEAEKQRSLVQDLPSTLEAAPARGSWSACSRCEERLLESQAMDCNSYS